MKPEHVEEFLKRFESKPCKGYGNYITVNLHGKKHPYRERTPGQIRNLKPERISALSATYAPAVPFPPGTRLTERGAFFGSEASAQDYLSRAGFVKLAGASVRKRGKFWRIGRTYRAIGWEPIRL